VLVNIETQFRFMDGAGICGSTRDIAMRHWNGSLPRGDRSRLSRKLYAAENHGKVNPSGSQAMIGIIYPGINPICPVMQGQVYRKRRNAAGDMPRVALKTREK
jgi:hypothetical protein